jgi:sortase (surface protein transpeptidase)
MRSRSAAIVAVLAAVTMSCGNRPNDERARAPVASSTTAATVVKVVESSDLDVVSSTAPLVTESTTALAAETTPAAAPSTTESPVVRSGANVSPDAPVGDPLSISIPSIGVESTLVPTGVLQDGTVAVPPDANIAGYFTGGPRPGQRGPAVIMGHVDSQKSGPGVFWHLVDLAAGAAVTVKTTTGPQQFVVQSVEQYPKNEFPTERVYGSVPEAALRLITCGGSFDRSIGHYRDNVIAFLVPAVSA